MAEGVDYSTSRPRPFQLAAAGKRFAVRYVGAGTADKHLSPSEAKLLTAAGIDIVCVCEGAEDDIFQGRTVGRNHARSADAQAKACGMPPTRPIYFAFDRDPTASRLNASIPYFLGVADILGMARVGIYGGFWAIDWAKFQRHATWYWQTYAWSYGKKHSANHLYQYRNGVPFDGGRVDLNQSMKPDFGQWRFGQTTPIPPPPPAPSPPSETPWLFTDHINNLASLSGYVGDNVYGSALAIESLSR